MTEPAGFEERDLLVAFVDLSDYARISAEQANGEAFAWISEFAERVGRGIEGSGGQVVKFIGDAALITFEAVDARAGVESLRGLKESIDSWLASRGLDSELLVRAHLGPVAVGKIGVVGDKRLDVIGRVVNEAAKLPQGPFVSTPELDRAILSQPAFEPELSRYCGSSSAARDDDGAVEGEPSRRTLQEEE